ncbi:glycerophosphodiester phosphodiesterase family protein [Asticcacaulis sp. AC402]|uniref:glycerophosphodiester phosphodiesterase family protein n=1 Tax=Asticcacaulis sp. AC402 TaxID=1282361 RepID=UPI0003C3F21F|nr:glycerophosphodiester phosphodiesterase family protein [Asticcacaulis sp. AC402]ESQ76407.1 glycerophosphoryl diester phosphodiesterase [Asticcacaulis sp. AC402]
MHKRYIAGGVVTAAAAVLYLANASWLASPPDTKPQLLAHRGVYQHYDREGLKNDTCTATRIYKPTHDLLENTVPSMQAAFDAGADAVEIDIHPTTDGDFAVFHDWTVDCRTDGKGTTRELSLAQLKALDIGYGYTHDAGKTFPFRGRFKGQMPSFSEVLSAFPDKAFLINIKSNSPREAEKLDAWLTAHPEARPQRLNVFAGELPGNRLAQLRPELKPVSKSSLRSCGLRYVALGWSGYLPKACRNTVIYVPQNLTWVMWGYPNRLQDRFAKAGSYIYLVGAMQNTNGLPGINTPEDYARVPKSWRMGVATDSIEIIGPLAKGR